MKTEIPADYIEVPTTHPLEVRRFKMPNGAHYVELVDESEATWEKYAKDLAKRNAANIERIRAARKLAFIPQPA